MNQEEIMNHLGGYILGEPCGDKNTYAPPVWDKLIEMYSPKTMIDVGCGGGYSLRYFLTKGIDAIGIEGHESAINHSPVKNKIIKHDYVIGPYIPALDIDIAWSCEFVEHVEEQFATNFMQTFAKCRRVAMTHATENFPGVSYHHVNCKESIYWIDKFKEYNFKYLEDISLMLRKLVDVPYNKGYGFHVKKTLMLFERNDV